MIGVCIPYDSSDLYNNQWSFVLSHFKVDQIYLMGVPKNEKINLHYLKDAVHVKTAEDLPKDIPLVLLAPESGHNIQGSESLIAFKHPADVIYLFGSDHVHFSEDNLGKREPEFKIYIPTTTKDQMYSFVSGAITLYDGIIKNG